MAKETRQERRRGAWMAVVGLVGAVCGLALGLKSTLHGDERPQLSALLLFAAAIALYGTGLHQVVWAPTSDPDGVPRNVRPWVTVLLCFVTWWLLAVISGLVAGLIRDGAPA